MMQLWFYGFDIIFPNNLNWYLSQLSWQTGNPKQNIPEQKKASPSSPKQCKHRKIIPNLFERFLRKHRFSFSVQLQPVFLPWNLSRAYRMANRYQTFSYILLSNVSLVTKSSIIRFFDDDAFNPLVAFARFPSKRLITVGKFERHVKDHLSISLMLRFHVFRRNKMTHFACICKYFAVFWHSPGGSLSETVLQAGIWSVD